MEALEWTGKPAFNAEDLREWTVDGTRAGRYKSANGLTYVTIEGAGHMVRPLVCFRKGREWSR